MYSNNKRQSKSFPDPLAPQDVKQGKKYGLKYAKAIEGQWGKMQDTESLTEREIRLGRETVIMRTEPKTPTYTKGSSPRWIPTLPMAVW